MGMVGMVGICDVPRGDEPGVTSDVSSLSEEARSGIKGGIDDDDDDWDDPAARNA